MLILAGITINSLTGSDSAPAKANEAAQKNDIGTAKDEISLLAVNAKTEGYETAYVGNGVSSTDASNSVGRAVIKAVVEQINAKNQYGKATAEITGYGTIANITDNATITIGTRDFELTGTITLKDGVLTWGDIEDNTPGIKIINVPSFVAKDSFVTLDVERRKVSGNAKWTSDKPAVATVEDNTGKVKGVAEGTATITASVTDNGTTYTSQCTIIVREVVMPQVGDFVDYKAGTWTADTTDGKIKLSVKDGNGVSSTIDANTSTDLPSSNWQFGGFTVGGSKDGNATPNLEPFNYVKEKITENGTLTTKDITGWRIFDIAADGTITLISAGCPEDYYHSYTLNNGYKSEYILTGDKTHLPANFDVSGLNVRDWTADYVTGKATGGSATVLTKSKLDDWYTKYITNGTVADTYISSTFQKIYKTNANAVNNGRYESLIDNYSEYWLGSSFIDDSYDLYTVSAGGMLVYLSSYNAKGLRVLVSLPSGISLKETPSGTKTITSRSNDYTYNVWEIK